MSETIETSTDPITGHKKVSIAFTRKLSDGNYGGTECTAWVEGEYDADANTAAIAEAAAQLFIAAKAAVFDELGIKWEVNSDTGLVTETETPFVSTAAAAAAVGRSMGGEASGAIQDGIKVMNFGKEGVSTDPVPAGVLARVKADGITAIWDQRHTATGRQPQFKEAVSRGGVGHGKDGSAKGYWTD